MSRAYQRGDRVERPGLGRAGVAVALGLLLPGACIHRGGGTVHEERFELASPVDELKIALGAGDLRVVGADVARVTAVARVQGESNHLGSRVEGRRVELFAECNAEPCSLDVVATVPSPLLLALETGAGDITAKDLTGASISASTGAGDVDLRTAMPVELLSVKTGAGDVAVAVPHGTYKLQVNAGAGDEEVEGVSHDPAAVASIAIQTGAGDVSLRGR